MKLAVVLCLAVWLAVLELTGAVQDHSKSVVITHDSSHTEEEGGGHDHKGGKHGSHDYVDKGEKKAEHHDDEANKGEDLEENHKVSDKELGGKKSGYHGSGHHKSYSKSGGGSGYGIKYRDGSRRKKNNFKKGFREKYHKDEQKKHDSFYSDSHKDGEYKLFGKQHAKAAVEERSKKKANRHKGGKSEGHHQKAYKKAGGHKDNDHKGYQSDGGSKDHYNHHDQYAKKGGTGGGKHYRYYHH